jgi:hypothetical protein
VKGTKHTSGYDDDLFFLPGSGATPRRLALSGCHGGVNFVEQQRGVEIKGISGWILTPENKL